MIVKLCKPTFSATGFIPHFPNDLSYLPTGTLTLSMGIKAIRIGTCKIHSGTTSTGAGKTNESKLKGCKVLCYYETGHFGFY